MINFICDRICDHIARHSISPLAARILLRLAPFDHYPHLRDAIRDNSDFDC